MPRPIAETTTRRRGGRRAPRYLRRRRWHDSLLVRGLFKGAAVVLIAAGAVHGLAVGGQFDDPASPLYNLEGRIAGFFGQQAERIEITGLKYHRAPAVLAAIGVRSGGPLFGFEPDAARRLLENLDWVKEAEVEKIYPNGLRIRLREREPIALWQTAGAFYPVDAAGVALVSLAPGRFAHLPLVTGEGANSVAAQLVNRLEARKGLRSRVKAAARVGRRRWNLYLASGLKVLLPERNEEKALDTLQRLLADGRLEERAVRVLDLRLPDRIALLPQDIAAAGGSAREGGAGGG